MQLLSYPILLIFTGTAFGILLVKRFGKPKSNLPYPPGPKGYPIIGNLFDLPFSQCWLVYDKWLKKYDGWVFFKILGQPILIMDDLSKISDLFETRSSIYSSRVTSTMISELMNAGFVFSLAPYSPRWRQQRRIFHNHFHPNIVTKYRDIQMKGAHDFLLRLLENIDDLKENIRYAFTSTMVDIVYGKDLTKPDDPYIPNVCISASGIVEAAVPGKFLVDLVPILKYIPAWVPGAGFKKLAAECGNANVKLLEDPWNEAKMKLKDGSLKDCMVKDVMNELAKTGFENEAEQIAMEACATASLAGSDTTISSVQTFFLAMALYPDVQKKAQAEIDAVFGNARLPTFEDRGMLPYVNAVIKESMRWQNVTPFGGGHMSTEDDVYDGYFIPKGTIVIGNTWSILHDPTVYKEPLEFVPERFLKEGKLDPTVRDPKVAAFGFGRRTCPGRFFVDQSMWCFVSSVLAVYDIQAKKDKHGNLINIRPEMSSGLISYPIPFDCNIKPRSLAAEELIREAQV